MLQFFTILQIIRENKARVKQLNLIKSFISEFIDLNKGK